MMICLSSELKELIVLFSEVWNQVSQSLFESAPSLSSIFIRLLLALVLGGIVGLDREAKKRSAGFKTHSMVCIGATLVMLMSEYIHYSFGQEGDISRLGAQVISGIGFLGVGTIITSKYQKVSGLTTAAGLWTCACIGLSIGIGFISGAVIASFFVMFLLRILKSIDMVIRKRVHFADIYAELRQPLAISDIARLVSEIDGVSIVSLVSVPSKIDSGMIGVDLLLKLNLDVQSVDVVEKINKNEYVTFAHTVYI